MKVISRASSRGLDGFAFFVANLQTGFGPFLAVYFTQAKWTQSDIGFALTVGSLVSLLGQVPGGAFVDAVRSRRFAAGFSVVAIALSAFALAMWPNFLVVLLAMAAHSAASCILTPPSRRSASVSSAMAGRANGSGAMPASRRWATRWRPPAWGPAATTSPTTRCSTSPPP